MEALKNLFNSKVVEAIADSTVKFHPEFNVRQYVGKVLNENWEDKELKERISHIAVSLKDFLPSDYKKACVILEKVSEDLPSGFEQMPLPTFIEFHGLNDFKTSINTLEKITQGSTGEFAIRPFLKENPKRTLGEMKKWATSKNEHVRRLSSEGCRPRLPWGGNFQDAIDDPKPVLEILEILKNDDSLYVRKSVANNLNDISKDHADIALQTSARWIRENHQYAKWIVKKGLRGLLKNANPTALQMFGFAAPTLIEVRNFIIQEKSIKIVERINFFFTIKNKSKSANKLRVEYLIDFQKKKGSSTKVFQLSEFEIEGNTERKFNKYQSFADLTTRKHYTGKHKISIRINGEVKSSLTFDLLEC